MTSATKEEHKKRFFLLSFTCNLLCKRQEKRGHSIPHCIRFQEEQKGVLFSCYFLFKSIYFTSIEYIDFLTLWIALCGYRGGDPIFEDHCGLQQPVLCAMEETVIGSKGNQEERKAGLQG